MVIRRIREHVSTHNWFAVSIDVLIVIVGVFIGTQVANWNEARLDRLETQRMLTRLKPELRNLLAFYASARSYYRLTREFATIAFAGWSRDPSVSDRDFVIAAYQASQIYGTGTNNATWATIFGAGRLGTIDDSVIRENLSYLMYAETNPIDTEAVDTPYRQNVRRVIPVEIQDAIRAKCGDRSPADNPQLFYLPKTCRLNLDPAATAKAAAALRDRPQLLDDLRWHTAAGASFVANLDVWETKTRTLSRQISTLD